MAAMLCFFFVLLISVTGRAQLFYDVTTQSIISWQGGQVIADATSNIGQFVITAADGDLRLVGNSGEVQVQTGSAAGIDPDGDGDNDLIYDGPVALATNHNSDLAVVHTNFDGTNTTLSVTMIRNTPGNGKIHIAGSVLESTLPSPQLTWTNPPYGGSSTTLADVQAAMDRQYLYITCTYWRGDLGASVNQYWYAIATVADNPTWVVPPQPIPRPNDGLPAWGLAQPTITCNRWQNSTSGTAVIGYAYVYPGGAGRQRPASTTITVGGPPPASSDLVEPPLTPLSTCFWVRAVNMDDPSGASPTHYFYAYDRNGVAAGQYAHPTLWSTDATTVWGPISTDLVLHTYPAFDATIKADPAVGDGYVSAIPGQAATCYCAFAEYVDDPKGNRTGVQNLRICREQGNIPYTIQSAPSVNWFALGCNQMGILVPFNAGTDQLWRSFRPFFGDIMENTVASGLCKVNPNADPSILGIGVGTHAKLNDTLRVFSEMSISPSQLFQFAEPSGPVGPLALWAGEHPSATIDADPGNARGHIILDNGANIDFGGSAIPAIAGVILHARSDGSIEYNGAVFNNQLADQIGCEGETRVGGAADGHDTTEVRRGIWYMNAPLSYLSSTIGIVAGSIFGGVKGQVRFAATTSSNPFLTISGQNSGMNFDSTYMYLGSSSTSTFLKQISAIDQNDGHGPPSSITFTNGLISNLWQKSGYGWGNVVFPVYPRPDDPGSAAQIWLEGVADINISNNGVLYTMFEIKNPVNTVNFNYNFSWNIKNLLTLLWTSTGNTQFQGQANILHNSISADWPFGSGTMTTPTQSIIVDGFKIGDQRKVMIDDNFFAHQSQYNSTDNLFNPNATGVWLKNGTNADVSSNIFNNYGIGIHNIILNLSNSFYCNNTFARWGDCQPGGTGIFEETGSGACFPKLNVTSHLSIGYRAGGTNASTLIQNSFNGNTIGAQFEDQAATIVYGSHTGTDNYAAYNHFNNNTQTQIGVIDDGMYDAQPEFGNNLNNGKFGENTFTAPTGAYHFTNLSGQYSYPINPEVTENHWNPGINEDPSGSSISNEVRMNYISYINTAHSINADLTFECGGGFISNGGKGALAQAIEGNNPCQPGDTAWLYYEAMQWYGIDNQKGLDTMRLFVERYPTDRWDVPEAINYTLQFVDKIAEHQGYYDYQPWIDEYNWLTSIYLLDTEEWYPSRLLLAMAEAENMFDRNEAVNLYWNIEHLFPFDSNTCNSAIKTIREYQTEIPQDTTPFHKIAIPPMPYRSSSVKSRPAGTFSLDVSPNPANREMTATVEATYAATAKLEIYDELGQPVHTIPTTWLQLGENRITFDCSSLPAGNYYLRLAAGGAVRTARIVIQH